MLMDDKEAVEYYEDQLEGDDIGFPLDEVTEENHKKMRKFETPDFANALLSDTDLLSTKNDELLGGKGELLGSDLMTTKKRKGKEANLTSYQNIFRLL